MGRANFSCIRLSETAYKTIPIIRAGEHPPKPILDHSCAKAPCLNRPTSKQKKIKAGCVADGGCPHEISIETAQESETIVSNFHSLMYSVSLSERVSRRKVLIFDESHNLANQLRDFLKVRFKVRRKVLPSEIAHIKTTEQWYQFLTAPEQVMLLRTEDQQDSWKSRLEKLMTVGNTVANSWHEPETEFLFVELVPTSVSAAAKSMLFNLAEKVIFLSGTIFSHFDFLKPLGINPDEIPYLRIASDFPAENRKVFLPKSSAKDLSFKGWKDNLPWAINEIKTIASKYQGVKGIVHTNSYRASADLQANLNDDRFMYHTSETFVQQLQAFYDTDEPKIFVSPTVAEGYSFDDDYARFQIILTPKYDPASDAFVKYLLDNGNWKAYRYEALKVFSQQCGRVVRSRSDKGETFLIGSGFNSLLKNCWKQIPNWQKAGFVEQIG